MVPSRSMSTMSTGCTQAFFQPGQWWREHLAPGSRRAPWLVHLEPEHARGVPSGIDDSADALECDVRLTSDGTLVCIHDRRIDRTSRGSGSVSGRDIDELMARLQLPLLA